MERRWGLARCQAFDWVGNGITFYFLLGNKVEQVFEAMLDTFMDTLVGRRQVVPEGTAHSLGKMVAG